MGKKPIKWGLILLLASLVLVLWAVNSFFYVGSHWKIVAITGKYALWLGLISFLSGCAMIITGLIDRK